MFPKMYYFHWAIVLIAVLGITESTNDSEMGRHNRIVFSPRMEYAHWRPIGRGDPLQNDPTFDYVPPVLERVRYWASSDEREEEKHLPEEDQQGKYHFPNQALRSEQDTYSEPETLVQERDRENSDDFSLLEGRTRGPIRRKDSPGTAPGFMRFVEAPQFRPRPLHKPPLPATMLIPPPVIKAQGSKPATSNALWVDDPSIWLSPPPAGGTTLPFIKYTPDNNEDIEVVPSKEVFIDTSTPMTSSENYITDSIAEESMQDTQSTVTLPPNPWTLQTLLQKEVVTTSQQPNTTPPQETTKEYQSTTQHDVPTRMESTYAYTTSPYSTTWFNQPQPTRPPTNAPQPSTTRFPVPQNMRISSTLAPSMMATDSIFSNIKVAKNPLIQPMNLIIQGHSKVKTYGPIRNDNSLVAENLMHLHPKQSEQEPIRTKHLHDKHSKSNEEEEEDVSFKSMFEGMNFGLGFLFGDDEKDHKYRKLDDEEFSSSDEQNQVPVVEHLHFGNEVKEEKDTPETEAKKRGSTLVSLQGLVDSKTLTLSDDIIGERGARFNKEDAKSETVRN